MRLNKFLAENTKLSRRKADEAISSGLVTVNGKPAELGKPIEESDQVSYGGRIVSARRNDYRTILLNKPTGYVCSRNGQGSRTIYSLLPPELHGLNPVGRLDKDSSGLLVMTDDGQLANNLAHPSSGKEKVYQVTLDKPINNDDKLKMINGVELDDGVSKLKVIKLANFNKDLTVSVQEGRNRQIRRTFEAIGYEVTRLHRTNFGTYELNDITKGEYIIT